MEVPRPLGLPGRARGVEPEGDFVGGDRRRLRPFARDQLRPGKGGIAGGRGGVFLGEDHRRRRRERGAGRLERRGEGGGGDDETGAAVGEQEGELGGRQQRIERHRHHTRLERPPEGDGKGACVTQQEGDPLLPCHAKPGEPRGEGARGPREAGIGERAPGVSEGGTFAPPLAQVPLDEPEGGVGLAPLHPFAHQSLPGFLYVWTQSLDAEGRLGKRGG